MKERLSIYFPAGDFTEALRRHQDGEAQSYATHDEVAKLLLGLADEGFDVTAYSLITPSAKTNRPAERVRIVDVGSNRFDDPRLTQLFRQDRADLAVIHFPHLGLLGAGSEMKGRAFPVLASSYNRRGLRPWLERRRLAGLLNQPKFTWVSNHCLPATRHLADLGVKADRLIPWDVPHPTSPSMSDVKKGNDSAPFRLAYAGSMIASKGVGDVLEAVALLNASGLDVQCELAGGGEIDRFRSMAEKRGIASKITFLGVIGNDKVVEMFRNADAVVVPSRPVFSEGFPLTLFEAIATRTPIICSDHPMFVPILKDRRTAMVYPAGEPRALAEKVRQLFGDPDLQEILSRNADLSWADLQQTANWRQMIMAWATEGDGSPYLARHSLPQL